jgi:hypothetical protein
MAKRSARDLELLKKALRKSVLAGGGKPKRREREDEEDGVEEGGDRQREPRRDAPKVAKPKGYAEAVTPKR